MRDKTASTRRISTASRSKNKAWFIERAKVRFDDLYNYSKVRYSNSTRKVTIICPKHGEFKQTPFNHINGTGCPYCSYGRIADNEYITLAMEGNGYHYDLSKSGYTYKKPLSQKIVISCLKHQTRFIRRADSFLEGRGCELCKKEKQNVTPIIRYDQNKHQNGNNNLKITVGDKELLNAEIKINTSNPSNDGNLVQQVII